MACPIHVQEFDPDVSNRWLAWSESIPLTPSGEIACRGLTQAAADNGVPSAIVVALHDPVGILSELNQLLGVRLSELEEYADEAQRKLWVGKMIDSLGDQAYDQARSDYENSRPVDMQANRRATIAQAMERGTRSKQDRLANARIPERDAFVQAHPARVNEALAAIETAAREAWSAFETLEGRHGVASGKLTVVGPTPHALQQLIREGRRVPAGVCLTGATTFDITDYSLVGNLLRMESIRRYMEGGIEAIRPPPDAAVKSPSGLRQPPAPDEGWSAWVPHMILRAIYYLGLGPLVDRILKKRIDAFRWHEEVERLCTHGAELSGIDTMPVTPKPNIFYKMGGFGEVLYVDARGLPIEGIHGTPKSAPAATRSASTP